MEDANSPTESVPFEQEYDGYDPRLNSQRYDSFDYRGFSADNEKAGLEDGYDSYVPPSFENGFNEHEAQDSPYTEAPEFTSSPINDLNGHAVPASGADIGVFTEQPQSPVFGSVLPPPEEMEPEEGFILREWKRQNALNLEEKERREKEMLNQIMDEADDYKRAFYQKRNAHVDAQMMNNRNKEQVFLSGQEHFHKTAEKHYWKAVSELIPTEIPTIETKRGRDKDKKKTTVIFNQGPKPGKVTDMTRMRQVLLKLKHDPPAHMKTAPPPPPAPKAEAPKAEAPKAEAPKAEAENTPAPVDVAA